MNHTESLAKFIDSFEVTGLSATQRKVYAVLAYFADPAGYSWVSPEVACEAIGCCTSLFYHSIAALRKKKAITQASASYVPFKSAKVWQLHLACVAPEQPFPHAAFVRLTEKRLARSKKFTEKTIQGKFTKGETTEESRAYMREATRKRMATPLGKLSSQLRVRMHSFFKASGIHKNNHTLELLGCSFQELLALWGVAELPEGRHIDHICPLSQAQTPEELEKLCHHSNLQLLPAADNLAKGNRRTCKGEQLCLSLLGRAWVD